MQSDGMQSDGMQSDESEGHFFTCSLCLQSDVVKDTSLLVHFVYKVMRVKVTLYLFTLHAK